MSTMQRSSIHSTITVALLLVFAAGCASSVNPISGRKSFGYAWSPQEEIQIGSESDASIVAQYGEYDDRDLAQYVDSLGQALVRVSHVRRGDVDPVWANMPFHFRVLDSPVVNAFALPGGFVYVTRGLLAHLENEAQLAVVLGHEIGHIVGRHGSRAMRRQQFGMGALLLGAIGSQAVLGGNAAQNVMDVGGTATQLMFLKYGRDAESESDQLGVEYAAMAGYRAAEGAAFFRSLKRLSDKAGAALPSLLSSHPDPGNREIYIQQRSQRYAADFPINKVGRSSLFRHVHGLVYGEDPRQGFVQAGVFYHPQMKFRFPVPSGFQAINQPTQVVMVPENQQAVVVFAIEASYGRAREAADAFKAQEGMQVVESGLGQAGGLPSHYVIADASDSEGNALRLRVQYIEYAGSVFSFTGMALKNQWSTYAGSFSSTMQGFRRETNQAILSKQPSRVALRTVRNTTTFNALVSGQSVDPLTLAILNQVELNARVPAGMIYKIVR